LSRPLRLGPRAIYPLKAGLTLSRSALWLARGAPGERRPGLRILFYHRVTPAPDALAVRPDRFRAQMARLADDGFTAVDVSEIVCLLARGEAPPRTIGLAFDDGYADVAEHALPELQRHGFTATVYVATGVTGGRSAFTWYDRQPPLLSWDEIASLDGDALRFGAHTVTHPDLRALPEDGARAEIEGSKRELEERLGRPVDTFSYPAGLYGERERRLVAEAGFSSAVTVEPGANLPGGDLLALRRIQIDARDSLLDFRAKVAGAHDAPLPGRALYRRLRYGDSRRS
jgi:peptidoglycan/xylan/chitin deacetylase (PgdA/CDA1 family)